MGLLSWLTGGGPVVDAIAKVGGRIVDRLLPPKMSEKERMEYTMKMLEMEKIDTTDARQMYMTELRMNKMPWLVRMLNGFLRPTAGWLALLGLVYPYVRGFSTAWGWNLPAVPMDAVTQSMFLTVIGFFFGTRSLERVKGAN